MADEHDVGPDDDQADARVDDERDNDAAEHVEGTQLDDIDDEVIDNEGGDPVERTAEGERAAGAQSDHDADDGDRVGAATTARARRDNARSRRPSTAAESDLTDVPAASKPSGAHRASQRRSAARGAVSAGASDTMPGDSVAARVNDRDAVQDTLRPAPFGDRFVAWFVDAALLFVAQWLSFLVLGRQLQAIGMSTTEPCTSAPESLCDGPSTAAWVVLAVMLVLVTFGYHALTDGLHGASPGKRLVGLRVVNAEGDSALGLGVGAVRSLLRQLPWVAIFLFVEPSPVAIAGGALAFVIPLIACVGWAIGAFDTKGRALHDRVLGTAVVVDDRGGETTPWTSDDA